MGKKRKANVLAEEFERIRRKLSRSGGGGEEAGPDQDPERRRRAQNCLRTFAGEYFKHCLTHRPSPMHLEFYRWFENMIGEAVDVESGRMTESGRTAGNRIVFAAPRGNAKSTIASLILPLWCIAGGKRKFIALVSDTTEQASDFLEIIKAELESNPLLRADFPEICREGPVWKHGQIVTANGIRVKCWGKGKRIRGARHGSRRPDLIICDDLENDEAAASPARREKDRDWFFKALMKAGAKYTVAIVVGTLLHYDSLTARLLSAPGWRGQKWRAVIRWSGSPLWREWEAVFTDAANPSSLRDADAFFRAHEREMLDGTEVLWPEAEDYYYLMKMRVAEGPSAFDSEKQNEPVNPADCLFAEEWFAYHDNATAGENDRLYCAVDPSLGGRNRFGDPSAIVIIALRAEGGFMDVLVADIRRRAPDEIIRDLLDYGERFRFERVAVESVQFQEMFKDEVVKQGAARNLYLPVEGVRPVADKNLRIARLQPHVKNGVIRFRREQQDLLRQLKYFPRADHDDGPDALEMAFALARADAQSRPRIRAIGAG